MLTDEGVIVTAPQVLDAVPETVIAGMAAMAADGAAAGTLLVRATRSRSPGRTWRVGDSAPLSVIKQKRVLPLESTMVW
jgi:hypothetical protein